MLMKFHKLATALFVGADSPPGPLHQTDIYHSKEVWDPLCLPV